MANPTDIIDNSAALSDKIKELTTRENDQSSEAPPQLPPVREMVLRPNRNHEVEESIHEEAARLLAAQEEILRQQQQEQALPPQEPSEPAQQQQELEGYTARVLSQIPGRNRGFSR